MPVNKTAVVNGESGFTLIDLLFTASIICLLATMAVPGLLRARGAAQSSSAVGTLRVVNSAQLSFAVTCGSGFYSPSFQMLGIVPPSSVTAFLPPELSSGASFTKQGYTFSMTGTALPGAPGTCNGQPQGSSAPGYSLAGAAAPPAGPTHPPSPAHLAHRRRRHDLRAPDGGGCVDAGVGPAAVRHARQQVTRASARLSR